MDFAVKPYDIPCLALAFQWKCDEDTRRGGKGAERGQGTAIMFAISIVWWKCVVRKNLVSSKVFYGMLGYKNRSRCCVVLYRSQLISRLARKVSVLNIISHSSESVKARLGVMMENLR